MCRRARTSSFAAALTFRCCPDIEAGLTVASDTTARSSLQHDAAATPAVTTRRHLDSPLGAIGVLAIECYLGFEASIIADAQRRRARAL